MSNQLGSKLDKYLEKQIILDFHFRGEQDVFEAEYSYLIEKAQALLGEELYFKLSECVGEPLIDSNPSLYEQLWD